MDEKQNENLKQQEESIQEVQAEEEMTVHFDEATDEKIIETDAAENYGQEGSKDETQQEDVFEQLKQELAREKSRAEENHNRLLRTQADFDNFRKRTLKEKEELRKFAAESLMMSLLPVLDNFQRALQSPPGDGEKFLEGVKMIYRQLMEVLENEGLEVINSQGEEFDPNIHEAVMHEETDEQPDSTVTLELRKGYLFKGKLIRPAMVKVARSL